MKKNLLYIFIFTIPLILASCASTPGWSTMYNKTCKNQFIDFNCSTNYSNIDSLVIIKASDIKNCYFQDTSKITWLLFVHIDCKKTVKSETLLYQKYKDKVNFIIINDDYSLNSVKENIDAISHPIFLIDPKYSNSRTSNTKLYISELFNPDIGKRFTSNILTYRGEILEMTWEVNEEMLDEAILSIN